MQANKKERKPSARRRGFSIVECVIALTMIVLIALVAIDTASKALSITTNAFYDWEAHSVCEDVIECFKRSTEETFPTTLEVAGYEFEGNGPYSMTREGTTYTCQLMRTPANKSKVVVTAVTASGETIELTYTKG